MKIFRFYNIYTPYIFLNIEAKTIGEAMNKIKKMNLNPMEYALLNTVIIKEVKNEKI